MVEFKILTLPDYNIYAERISLMNTMVFEELYYGLHQQQAPYDYYHADNVISPKDKRNHNTYFNKVKPLAIELFEKWYDVLTKSHFTDDRDKKTLSVIGQNIKHAQDMVDLVWYSQLLHKAAFQYQQAQKSA